MFHGTLTGNIGQNATWKNFGDRDVVNFSVANNQFDKNNNKTTVWVACSKWVKAGKGEEEASRLVVGAFVVVQGAAMLEDFQRRDQTWDKEWKLKVDRILSVAKNGEVSKQPQQQQPQQQQPQQQQPQQDVDDDDLPF